MTDHGLARLAAVGKRLVLEETVNFLLVTVAAPISDFEAKNERGKQEEIQSLAALVLKLTGTRVAENLQPAPYRWVFRFPTPLDEGARFSTAPEQDLRRMWSWASRVDGGDSPGPRLLSSVQQRGHATTDQIADTYGQWVRSAASFFAPDQPSSARLANPDGRSALIVSLARPDDSWRAPPRYRSVLSARAGRCRPLSTEPLGCHALSSTP